MESTSYITQSKFGNVNVQNPYQASNYASKKDNKFVEDFDESMQENDENIDDKG